MLGGGGLITLILFTVAKDNRANALLKATKPPFANLDIRSLRPLARVLSDSSGVVPFRDREPRTENRET